MFSSSQSSLLEEPQLCSDSSPASLAEAASTETEEFEMISAKSMKALCKQDSAAALS